MTILYSRTPETVPFILAMDPVGSAITFPHDLHVTVLVTCEYRTFSALHSLH